MSYVSLTGLTVAISDLLAMGLDAVEAHARSLATLLAEELEGSGWKPFRSVGDKAASSHIITLSHQDGGVEAVEKALRDENIVCSIRNSRIRISLADYNDESDVRTLTRVLRRVLSR